MPPAGPKNTKNQTVWRAFTEAPPPAGAKERVTNCKFYTKYANNAVNGWRIKKHLESCRPYLNNPVNKDSYIVLQ